MSFNLRKFLIENKLTSASKKFDENVIQNPDGNYQLAPYPFEDETTIQQIRLNRDIKKPGRLGTIPKKVFRRLGVPIHFGLYPNWRREYTTQEIKKIFRDMRYLRNIDDKQVIDIVRHTVPRVQANEVAYSYIVKMGSEAPMNTLIVDYIKSHIHSSAKVITVDKLEHTLDTVVNQQAYQKADPVTRKIVDDFLKALGKYYKPGEKFKLKASPDSETGLPGIRAGGRPLLNPRYNTSTLPTRAVGKILIVDDNMYSGGDMREVISSMLKVGFQPNQIIGYVFAVADDGYEP